MNENECESLVKINEVRPLTALTPLLKNFQYLAITK